MKKIGVGLIGVQPERSWAAVAHIPALRALADEFEIVALATTKDESAAAAAKHYGVAKAFGSSAALCACEAVDLRLLHIGQREIGVKRFLESERFLASIFDG